MSIRSQHNSWPLRIAFLRPDEISEALLLPSSPLLFDIKESSVQFFLIPFCVAELGFLFSSSLGSRDARGIDRGCVCLWVDVAARNGYSRCRVRRHPTKKKQRIFYIFRMVNKKRYFHVWGEELKSEIHAVVLYFNERSFKLQDFFINFFFFFLRSFPFVSISCINQ